MPETILALGEVLWDIFSDGPRFGGAPANFACACAGLGRDAVQVFLASAVGRDSLGEQARNELHAHGVATTHLASSPHITGQVFVHLDADGRASYRFVEDPAWDHIPLTTELRATAHHADVIAFGTLGQRAVTSRETIREVVHAAPAECLRLLDINLRPPHWTAEIVRASLHLANAVKLNDDELPIVAEILGLRGTESELLQQMVSGFSLRLIALTRGSKGSRLLTADGTTSELPSPAVSVVDTVGAGDAFAAAVAVGWLHGEPLDAIHRWATDVAAFVCTQPGGTPTLRERSAWDR